MPRSQSTSSISKEETLQIFRILLRDEDLSNKLVLDVGSRLGNILYVAALYTKSTRLIGVEFSEFFANLSAEVVNKFQLDEKITIIHDDIVNKGELLAEADVCLFFNPFVFLPRKRRIQLLKYMRRSFVKPGARFVSSPSVQEIFVKAGCTNRDAVDLDAWLEYEWNCGYLFVYRVRDGAGDVEETRGSCLVQ